MGSVSPTWSVSLPVDGTGDVQTVEASLQLELSGCPGGSTFSSAAAILKIGVTWYNASNQAIGADGNPLPSGEVYSRYEEVVRKTGSGGSGLTLIALKTNHAAGGPCGTDKPAAAVYALYRYYTFGEWASSCSGCTGSGYGPTSATWGRVDFAQGGGGGGD